MIFSLYYLLGRIFDHEVYSDLYSLDLSSARARAAKKSCSLPVATGNMVETRIRILEYDLNRKLNLSFRSGGFEQYTRRATAARGQQCSRRVKDVGIAVAWTWRGKVGVIENIKHLQAKLHIEVLRDPLDAIILEDGKVQIGYARAHQDVATCVAAKIETLRGCR